MTWRKRGDFYGRFVAIHSLFNVIFKIDSSEAVSLDMDGCCSKKVKREREREREKERGGRDVSILSDDAWS